MKDSNPFSEEHPGNVEEALQANAALILFLTEVLKENHEWHQKADDLGAYPDSYLCGRNQKALFHPEVNWVEKVRGLLRHLEHISHGHDEVGSRLAAQAREALAEWENE